MLKDRCSPVLFLFSSGMTSNEDLITIITDQMELYSREELEIIKEELDNRI